MRRHCPSAGMSWVSMGSVGVHTLSHFSRHIPADRILMLRQPKLLLHCMWTGCVFTHRMAYLQQWALPLLCSASMHSHSSSARLSKQGHCLRQQAAFEHHCTVVRPSHMNPTKIVSLRLAFVSRASDTSQQGAVPYTETYEADVGPVVGVAWCRMLGEGCLKLSTCRCFHTEFVAWTGRYPPPGH